jgi:60 kDa SS-A/Ro ribonucleoprotein
MLELIHSGKLPYEAVTGTIKPETNAWEALMLQMPIFALIRHLDTLDRNEVFKNPENMEFVVQRLTNQEIIERSKILPFRFFEAWKYAKRLPFELVNALGMALELAFVNIPTIDGRIMIGTDVSGSMTAPIRRRIGRKWRRSAYRYIDIAGIFTGALWKKNKANTIIIPFDTQPHPFNTSEFSTIMEITYWFSSIKGGGTDLGVPLRLLLQEKIEVDIFIGITDSQDWAGHGIANDLKDYRDKINPNLEAFLVRIDPYTRDIAFSLKNPRNYIISGWSDKVPQLISSILTGQTQLDAVKKIQI